MEISMLQIELKKLDDELSDRAMQQTKAQTNLDDEKEGKPQ
jgi:hypothetical protein